MFCVSVSSSQELILLQYVALVCHCLVFVPGFSANSCSFISLNESSLVVIKACSSPNCTSKTILQISVSAVVGCQLNCEFLEI